MILSKQEILKAVKNGKITLAPFEKQNVGAVSVDLRLGNYFRPLRASKQAIRLGNHAHYPNAFEKQIFVPDGGGLKIWPGSAGFKQRASARNSQQFPVAVGFSARRKGLPDCI